jgi:hypothetical protein
MFLTTGELAELTGYRRPSAQIRWLRAHGWRFIVNAQRRPIIDRGFYERRMLGENSTSERVEPNFEALSRGA